MCIIIYSMRCRKGDSIKIFINKQTFHELDIAIRVKKNRNKYM